MEQQSIQSSTTQQNPQPSTPRRHRLPKGWRVALISLGSLLGVLVVIVVIACYLVFTPARLTAIVNKLSDRYILCESNFRRVDLSLFRTFPNVGLEVSDVVLINPIADALGDTSVGKPYLADSDLCQTDHDMLWQMPGDTLAAIGNLTVAINLRDYLRHREIKVEKLWLDDVQASVYVAPDGSNNYTIFAASDTTRDTSEDSSSDSSSFTMPEHIDLHKIKIRNLNASYCDNRQGLYARLDDFGVHIDGAWQQQQADLSLKIDVGHLGCLLTDSVQADLVRATVDDLALSLKAQGPLHQLSGLLKVAIPQATATLSGVDYVTSAANAVRGDLLTLRVPFEVNVDSLHFSLSQAEVALCRYVLALNGDVWLPQGDDELRVDLGVNVDAWDVDALLALLPASFTSWQQGMDLGATLTLQGVVRGVVGDSVMPRIDAHVALADGHFVAHSLLPYDIRQVTADIDAALDLGSDDLGSVTIHSLTATTGRNRLMVSGSVDQLMGDMNIDARVRGNVQLPDLHYYLPDSLQLAGSSNLDLRVRTNLAQLTAVDLQHMRVEGRFDLRSLDVTYGDIAAQSPDLSVEVQIPARRLTHSFSELLSAHLVGGSLHAVVPAANLEATLSSTDITASISNVLDSTVPLAVAAQGSFGRITATYDSIRASLTQPHLVAEMVPEVTDPARIHYSIDYSSDELFAHLSDSMEVNVAGLSIAGSANYDSTRSNVLQQWNPNLDIDFKRGYLNIAQLQYMVQIPNIKFNYQPQRCEIANANVIFGNSDFYLSGYVEGLEQWLSHEDLLRGSLNFTSNFTNVDDLMDAISGLGTDADTMAAQQAEITPDTTQADPNPFIVPRDVDITLHTRIKECVAFGNDLQELSGNVTLNDGVAILEQVGFTCRAARMQLSALYRTPRVNHIFVGLDFHLLDIYISELIDMIPYVDTLVPMLASMDGHADFHLCAETYTDAYYRPKMSTLRGSAALTGDSLVVLDNETFSTIAKYMMFNKQTRNVIDSLDVELTVFRREVELYPTVLTMDKYQVVAAGRHNLDNNYNYHLEILKSPLPTRLALDVKGTLPHLGFALTRCRYAEIYRPEKQGQLEAETLRLKRMIREALEANVKETTRTYDGLNASE